MTEGTSHDRYRSVFRAGLFDDRTVIVTGGGTGIGRCIAHELASLGASVVVWGRREEPLRATVAEIDEDGGDASFVTGDITANGFDAVVRNNLLGGFLVARACYLGWMRDHGGAIVNITADSTRGIPLMAHSSAARAGMANLTHTLAVEWASSGVRVNAVAPGFVASSGYDTYEGELFAERLHQLPRLTLAQRHGTESEISAAVTFLLSPAAAYITGQELLVAGGSDLVNGLLETPPHDRLPPYEGFHRSRAPTALDDGN